MRGGDEHEKLALDGFMKQFFHSLLEQIRNYRDPAGNVPQPKDDDSVHLYMDNAGVGFTFSMDYAGRDRMTLGGLLNPRSGEMDKMVENFTVIIQSGQHVIMTNETVFRVWIFSPPAGGARPKCLDKAHLEKIMKSCKQCPLDAPWCMPGSILMAMDNERDHRKYKDVNNPKRPGDKRRLLADAIQLCIEAEVDSNVTAMGRDELCKFASYLRINLHFYDITSGDEECSDREDSNYIPDAPHYYLRLDNGHFCAIMNIQAFLRTMMNHQRMLCHDCQTIFSTYQLCRTHECTKSYERVEAKPKKEWTDPVTGLKTAYKPMKGNTSLNQSL